MVPLHGRYAIQGHAQAARVHTPQAQLRLGQSLVGRHAVPSGGRGVVPPDTPALGMDNAQVVLRAGVPLQRRPAVPCGGFGVIPRNAQAPVVEKSQIVLCVRMPLQGRLPEPAGGRGIVQLDAPALADLTEDPDPLAFYTPTYRPPAPGEVPRPSTVARELALTAGRRVATPVAVSSGWAVGDEPPLCPRCGREMVLRTAKNGRHKGGAFWGCPCYPKCRMIVRIDPSGGSDDDWS